MKILKLSAMLAIILLLFGIYIGPEKKSTPVNNLAQTSKQTTSGYIECKYYDGKSFINSLNTAGNTSIKDAEIRGGIVPHHLLAGNMISGFFKVLSVQKPDLIVIIGPNHRRIGQQELNTGYWDWKTPFGTVESDKDTVSRIIADNMAGVNHKLLEEEHSVSALVPYIKYYMPDTRIVPLLVHGNLGLKKSIELGRKIERLAGDKNYVVVASVDFSHYLPVEEADRMDKITLAAIKKKDLYSISLMGNDNLDSPPAVISLLTAMDRARSGDFIVLDHDNSGKMPGIRSDSTTSYFTAIFYKK